VPERGVPAAERPYLVSPLESWQGGSGWPSEVPAETAETLHRGYDAVLAGEPEAAREAAREAGADAPPAQAFPPALVLAAEADLLAGSPADAQARLEARGEDYPDYTALQLVLGRAAETAGDPVTAYAAYRRLAAGNLLAFDRSREMAPRVGEILARRVEDAVDRGEVEAAEVPLARLREWMPEESVTWRAARRLAEARADRAGELEALRQLSQRAPEDVSLVERRADLELQVGDPKAGLDLFTRLAAEHPDDARLAERVAYAKFRWRVAQMPRRVEEVASAPELQRGDLAVLLYWLVPRVRSGGGGTPRIASDILDDPRREEIARVVNLGLMDLDVSVHRFDPDRTVARAGLLRALLRLLRTYGDDACVASDGEPPSFVDAETTCAYAIGCGLVRDDEECAPQRPVSGAETVEGLRRVLVRLQTGGRG
jgi:hypothetical protein